MGWAFGEAWAAATNVTKALADLFDEAIGIGESGEAVGSVWEWLGGVFSEACDLMGFAWRHTHEMIAVGMLRVQGGAINMWEIMKWAWNAIVQTLAWASDNFTSILRDMLNGAITLALNFAKNIGEIFSEVWDYITSRGEDKIDFNFTPMLEGFKATVSKFPGIAGPQLSSVNDAVQTLRDQISGEEAIYQADKAKREGEAAQRRGAFDDLLNGKANADREAKAWDMSKMNEMKAGTGSGVDPAMPNPMKKKPEGGFVGLEDMAKRIQTSSLKMDESRQTSMNTFRSAKATENLLGFMQGREQAMNSRNALASE
jgi:hypothetical protein